MGREENRAMQQSRELFARFNQGRQNRPNWGDPRTLFLSSRKPQKTFIGRIKPHLPLNLRGTLDTREKYMERIQMGNEHMRSPSPRPSTSPLPIRPSTVPNLIKKSVKRMITATRLFPAHLRPRRHPFVLQKQPGPTQGKMTYGDRMDSVNNTTLKMSEFLQSKNGRFACWMKQTGNLVVTDGWKEHAEICTVVQAPARASITVELNMNNLDFNLITEHRDQTVQRHKSLMLKRRMRRSVCAAQFTAVTALKAAAANQEDKSASAGFFRTVSAPVAADAGVAHWMEMQAESASTENTGFFKSKSLTLEPPKQTEFFRNEPPEIDPPSLVLARTHTDDLPAPQRERRRSSYVARPPVSASDTEIAGWLRGAPPTTPPVDDTENPAPEELDYDADYFAIPFPDTASDSQIAGWFRAQPAKEESEEEKAAAAELDKMLMKARKKFNKLDVNGDNVLEGDELIGMAIWVWSSFHPGGKPLTNQEKEEEASKLLTRLDKNGDGFMSFDEFSEWCRKTFVEIERYRKGLADRTPKVDQVEETEPVAADAEDVVPPPADPLAHLKQVIETELQLVLPDGYELQVIGFKDTSTAAGSVDAMVDAMESSDAKRATTTTYRLVVSVEVLGDDSRHAVDTLLSHMPETIASGAVISSKPKGTGKKLTYMDHEGIVQVITESDHEKLNSVVHAKAAKPSKSRECCWLVLQNNGDLITCSKDGAVLSSTCDHYGLLRAPEPNKARRSKDLGVQGSYIVSEFLKDAKAAARESIRVDNQNIKQRKKPIGLPARSGCDSCIKISRLCSTCKAKGESNPDFYIIKHTYAISCDGANPDHCKGLNQICPRDDQLNCAVVDALEVEGKAETSNYFLSWSWGYECKMFVKTLTAWMKQEGLDPSQVWIWICFFCNNQFRVLLENSNADADLDRVFEDRILGIKARGGHMLLMLDNWKRPLYLNRAWCFYEHLTALKKEVSISMLLPPSIQQKFQDELKFNGPAKIKKELLHVHSENSTASHKLDEISIRSKIEASGGFAQCNADVKQSLKDWVEAELLIHQCL